MNFYNLSKYFFNDAKLEEKSKFQKHFDTKYNKMTSDIQIPLKNYKILRDYFLKYNQDSQTKTFTEYGYSKSTFNNLKIITHGDLHETLKKIDKEYTVNKSQSDNKITWDEFFTTIQNIILQDKTFTLDNFLVDLAHNIQTKKFNFRKYKEKYNNTKSLMFYNGLRILFFENNLDPDYTVIKQNRL
jgi:hypothetical protein